MKRLFDIVAAAAGLILLSPLFAIIAVLIKWDSAGPVFFRQSRIGRHFLPFFIYKFRTMLSDAQLRLEVAGSRRELRRRFGAGVAEFFCYPAGRYDDRVLAAVRAAGYRGATTVDPGLGAGNEPFALKRVRVNADDTPQTLVGRLAS